MKLESRGMLTETNLAIFCFSLCNSVGAEKNTNDHFLFKILADPPPLADISHVNG